MYPNSQSTYYSTVIDLITMREDRGFNSVTHVNLPTKLMCIIAELNELEKEMEEATVDNPGEIGLEMADVAMYTIAAIHDLSVLEGRKPALRESLTHSYSRYQSASNMLFSCRDYAVKAFEAWRRERYGDVLVAHELLLAEICDIAYPLNFDLTRLIREKITINLERPMNHGGKHPDS